MGGLPAWHREYLGDVVRDERFLLASRFPILRWAWRIGAPTDNPVPGQQAGTPTAPATGGLDTIMDLKADQQTTLSGQYTDEVGNPVAAPAGAVVTYTVDDPAVIALTDLGDGTATAAATGALGQATVHAEAAFDGRTASGDLLIVVVPGDAERFTVVASDPVEVTPDV
mgnify:FL=1